MWAVPDWVPSQFGHSQEIEKMIEKLVITEDPCRSLKQLIEEDTIEFKKILTYVFDHIGQMKNETKIKCLAQVIAQIYPVQTGTVVNDCISPCRIRRNTMIYGLRIRRPGFVRNQVEIIFPVNNQNILVDFQHHF
jgi:hypothetical protein